MQPKRGPDSAPQHPTLREQPALPAHLVQATSQLVVLKTCIYLHWGHATWVTSPSMVLSAPPVLPSRLCALGAILNVLSGHWWKQACFHQWPSPEASLHWSIHWKQGLLGDRFNRPFLSFRILWFSHLQVIPAHAASTSLPFTAAELLTEHVEDERQVSNGKVWQFEAIASYSEQILSRLALMFETMTRKVEWHTHMKCGASPGTENQVQGSNCLSPCTTGVKWLKWNFCMHWLKSM